MNALARSRIADRLREVRVASFGESGLTGLAASLDIPPRAWLDAESGGEIPATMMLRFLHATGAEPRWLLTGRGPMFRLD